MSHVLNESVSWKPTASIASLKLRAEILKKIRHFFAERNILEVETPLLCHHGVTDPYIQSLMVKTEESQSRYLQTSPEYAMKRLLSAGSGSIYQICKAFRDEEIGLMHNPEFSILEWYRIGFDHHNLMNEMAEFLKAILNYSTTQRFTYAQLFKQYLAFDVEKISIQDLQKYIDQAGWLQKDCTTLDRDTCLQILMSYAIEPRLGIEHPTFVYDFPASQAALARINPQNPQYAERFELYIEGVEIANGFHELQNADEQRQRFLHNQLIRQNNKSNIPAIDNFFLAALEHGLPDCAGVALGIDRLMMIAAKSKNIKEVLSFNWENG